MRDRRDFRIAPARILTIQFWETNCAYRGLRLTSWFETSSVLAVLAIYAVLATSAWCLAHLNARGGRPRFAFPDLDQLLGCMRSGAALHFDATPRRMPEH